MENKKCVQSNFRQYNEKLFEEPIKYEYNYVDFANENRSPVHFTVQEVRYCKGARDHLYLYILC